MTEPAGIRFTALGVAQGARATLPLLIGMAPFGLVVGLLSAGKGLYFIETMLMSGIVFAGAAQLLSLEIWTDPAPILAATLAAGVVNLRMAPMGAALAPWLDRLRGIKLWGTLAVMVDHAFALSMANMRGGGRDAGFLLGTCVGLWVGWMAAVALGFGLAGVIALPPGHPLLFAGPAAFAGLLVPLFRGVRQDLAPFVSAGLLAVAAQRAGLPTPLPLLVGALAGAALGAWLELRRARGAQS